MLACCGNCYTKYLTPEKSLDVEVFKQTFGDEAELINSNGTPKVKMNASDEKPFKLCTCICHVQGINVLH